MNRRRTPGAEGADAKAGPPKSARRRAREFALQGLYQWLLNREDVGVIEAQMADVSGFEKADREHFATLLAGTVRHHDLLHEQIEPFLDRPFAELSPVEHAALLIGAYELVHQVEIPYRVVINEAVELTKSFGGTEGFRYVNGVLDKLAARVRPSETGR